MDFTAFNHNAWNPLHSIGMLWAVLHKIHCIQSCFLNPLHSVMLHKSLHSIGFHFFTLHGIHCIQSRCMESTAFNRDAFYHAAWFSLHSITMHGIHCIPSGCFGPCCIKSTAFNRDALGHAASTPLHSIGIHCATMQGILCIH